MGARAARPHRAAGANLIGGGNPGTIVSLINRADCANKPCTSGALQAGTPALPAFRALVVISRHDKKDRARLFLKVTGSIRGGGVAGGAGQRSNDQWLLLPAVEPPAVTRSRWCYHARIYPQPPTTDALRHGTHRLPARPLHPPRPGDPWETWNLVVSLSGPADLTWCFNAPIPTVRQPGAALRHAPVIRTTASLWRWNCAHGRGRGGTNVYQHPDDAEEAPAPGVSTDHPATAIGIAHAGDSDPRSATDHLRLILRCAPPRPIAVRTLSLRASARPTHGSDLDALHITPAYQRGARFGRPAPPGRPCLPRSPVPFVDRRQSQGIHGSGDRRSPARLGRTSRAGDFGSRCARAARWLAHRLGAAWCEGWEINAEKRALARINLSSLRRGSGDRGP